MGSAASPADCLVVGATVAGIAATLELCRAGLRVILVEPTGHIGGMTTGGLCITDYGNPATIGGFARQLYADIGAQYGRDHAYAFTPDVAQTVIDSYLRSVNATVLRSTSLGALTYSGGMWTAMTASGDRLASRYVIDATYEGDVVALAELDFQLGREGQGDFAEAHAGVRPPAHGDATVDPYVVPGDPGSGLLPGVGASGTLGTLGASDARVMAPGLRLTLTSAPRRLPWRPPPGYDPATYEITRRVARAGGNPLRNLHPIQVGSGDDADLNNYQMGSTDLIAQGGLDWVHADDPTRERLLAQYRDWTQGLLYFLATDPSIPAAIRSTANGWGLDPAQFSANGGWSPLLYVREARRLVGQAILTELEVEGERPVDDPIALASYPIDCHDCRYLVDGRGRLAVEGDLNVVHRPVGISMRCLVPATAPPGFVTATAISTTHVGWCAVRTEPVFAMMGQAAGLMVSLVARKCAPVESLSYDQLRAALEERGAVLSADS